MSAFWVIGFVPLTETHVKTSFEPNKKLAIYVLSDSAQMGFSNEKT